jgi:hypothetical protein
VAHQKTTTIVRLGVYLVTQIPAAAYHLLIQAFQSHLIRSDLAEVRYSGSKKWLNVYIFSSNWTMASQHLSIT